MVLQPWRKEGDYLKTNYIERTGGMVQVVELCKHEALTSNPNIVFSPKKST
jgi:hypothetical protein